MTKNTDILHEAKRLRLLAAALELQHYTSTAANVVEIPGGDQVIAIGAPAEVTRLLGIAPAVVGAGELPPKPHTTYNGYSDGSEPLWTAEQMEDYARAAISHAAAICDGVADKSKNSLFRSGAKICAGEIRTAQAGADQVDGEGGHHD